MTDPDLIPASTRRTLEARIARAADFRDPARRVRKTAVRRRNSP